MDGTVHWRTLSFRLEFSDYLKLALHDYVSPVRLLFNLLFSAWIAFVFAAWSIIEYGDWSYLAYNLIVAFALRFLLIPLIEYRVLSRRLKRSTVLEQVSELTVDSTALRTEREDARLIWRWGKVYGLVNTGAAIYVMVDAGHAVIIPARAFDSREEQDRFYRTVHGYWRACVRGGKKPTAS
ncbi:MAG: YcxB family protein [Asticcacaulis sp.]|nr:YcxB family protein [Asticcacaulis sp.]